jgi:hypothetical protein
MLTGWGRHLAAKCTPEFARKHPVDLNVDAVTNPKPAFIILYGYSPAFFAR